jgi:hypothetical protein
MHSALSGSSMTVELWCRTVTEQSDLRDVNIRGVRGDLWDWLYNWKGRRSFGLIINVLIEEWRSLDETERRRILFKYQRPDE